MIFDSRTYFAKIREIIELTFQEEDLLVGMILKHCYKSKYGVIFHGSRFDGILGQKMIVRLTDCLRKNLEI